jgi:hypothetical protein
MPFPFYRLFAAAAVISSLVVAGSASADPVTVPNTGSEQSVSVPHAEPGNDPAQHTPQGERMEAQGPHLSAPPQLGRDTGSASMPRIAPTNEGGPHSDVTSPSGVVPQSNEGAPRQPGSR